MSVRVNHSLKIPEIDLTTVADLEIEKQKVCYYYDSVILKPYKSKNKINTILKNRLLRQTNY